MSMKARRSRGGSLLALVAMGALIASGAVAGDAQPPSAAALAPSDANIENTAQLELFVDGLVRAQMDAFKLPTAVISIVKDGRVLFTKGYGYADIDKQQPVD